MKRPHIVFLCSEYPPGSHGGVGTLVRTLARGLAGLGARVTVVGVYSDLAQDIEEEDGAVRVVRLRVRPISRLAALTGGRALWQHLRSLNREHPIDVVEGTELAFWASPRDRTWANLIRMNGGHHFFRAAEGRPPSRMRGWLEVRSFSRADYLLAASNYVGTTTAELLGIEQPVPVIYNPVDTERFGSCRIDGFQRGRILFFGSLCEKKGIRQLVEGFPVIQRNCPHATLEILGRDTTDPVTGGSYRSRLEGLVDESVASRVRFHGVVPNRDLPHWLESSEICVLPSHMEAHPLAWIETMASGTVLVGGDEGPGSEVITDGVDGFLCNPRDPKDVARVVTEALSDGAGLATIAAQARLSAQRFAADRICADNLVCYEEIIRTHSSATGKARSGGFKSGE